MSSEESLERTQAVAPPSLTRAKRLLHRSYAKLPDFTPLEYRDWDDKQLRQQVLARLRQLVEEHAAQLGKVDTDSLLSALLNELTRMGPLQQLMKEEGVTEVMINGPDTLYVEKAGKLRRLKRLTFNSEDHLQATARQILAPLGKSISGGQPMADARMKDGSRVNVVAPPLSPNGTTITIRRFAPKPYTGHDLTRFGTLSPNMLRFLHLAVHERANIIVAGGTGSGKTTLLNMLSGFIPERERIVTIEDNAELQLKQEHLVCLEARESGLGGMEETVSIRDLVKNALRMRPDRIVVGECRGAEALDMLQAMNTGHDGSLTTLHANSPRDVLARLETLIMMAGYQLPIKAIRQQIASAVQVIVHQARLSDGTRKVISIMEITGIQEETILLQELFGWQRTGVAEDGTNQGRFICRGMIPKVVQLMRERGATVDLSMFAQAGGDDALRPI